MRDWLRRNPAVSLLGLLAAVLAGILALELSTGGPAIPSGTSRRAVPAEAKLLPPVVATAPEQAYPETAARPIFSPTRRPAPAVVATPQPTIQRNQFVLVGVTIAGNTRIAMLRERSNGRIHRVEKGRDVNGLKVAEIERESVTLAAGPEQELLTLSVQRPGAAAGQPPAVAAAAAGPFGQQTAPAAPGAAPAATAANPVQRNVPGAPVPAPAQQVAQPSAPGPLTIPPGPMPAGTIPSGQAPMTPEELLERRRARRAQQTQ
jgi:general secretion pathway protein N